MVEKKLDKNIEFVEKNKSKLLKEHANKYLLVYNGKVIDSFDQYNRAAEEGIRLYGVDGVFLVYHLTAKPPVNFVMEADI
jgi:ubiquinone/menaquinone biosynthesis C-methylase UbiE